MNPVVLGILTSIGCIMAFVPMAGIMTIWSLPVLIAQAWRRGEKRFSKWFKRFFKATLALLGISALALLIAISWPIMRIISSIIGISLTSIGFISKVTFKGTSLVFKGLLVLLSFTSSKVFANVASILILVCIGIWTIGMWDSVFFSIESFLNQAWNSRESIHIPQNVFGILLLFGSVLLVLGIIRTSFVYCWPRLRSLYKLMMRPRLNRKLVIAVKGPRNRDLVKKILDRGAHVDAWDYDWDCTPLFWAVRNDHIDIAKLLLDRGAKVDATDNDGWTSLHWAACRGHADIARLLLDRGAEVDARDDKGRTPLRFAAIYGNTGTARLLILNGADPFKAFDGPAEIIKFFKGNIDWMPVDIKVKL
jgi:hypothetical protein